MNRLVVLIVLCLITGCSTFYAVLLGIRPVKSFDAELNQAILAENDIKQSVIYIDPVKYLSNLAKIEADTREFNDALQLKMYDKNGMLLTKNINCTVRKGSDRRLNWFEFYSDSTCQIGSFEVAANIFFKSDTSLSEEFSYWDGCDPSMLDNSKETVVVYYSSVMMKESDHLISKVKEKFDSCSNIQLIYVSFDSVESAYTNGNFSYFPLDSIDRNPNQ